jgi:predicted  nucleic acid-binding Zn-ribbon protein
MAAQNVSNDREESGKPKLNHAEELAELKRTLEAKQNQEFEALRLLWDRDREELRKTKEEIRELREENVSLKVKIDTATEKNADAARKTPAAVRRLSGSHCSGLHNRQQV